MFGNTVFKLAFRFCVKTREQCVTILTELQQILAYVCVIALYVLNVVKGIERFNKLIKININ